MHGVGSMGEAGDSAPEIWSRAAFIQKLAFNCNLKG